MRKLLRITSAIGLIALVMLSFYSCNKNEDLVTADAKEGGLVIPVTTSVPYKLGNTPSVDVEVLIPVGPAITSVEIMNTYTDATDGSKSNQVKMKTVSIGGANSSGDHSFTFNITYTDLKNGILLNGNPLPADETTLAIGSNWNLVYVCVMEDGSKVINNASTKIGVANLYAGSYHVTGQFIHPVNGPRDIDEDKDLSALGAYDVQSTLGDLGPNYPIKVTVNPVDNSCTVVELPPTTMVIQMTLTQNSRYEPSTGKFYLYYQYEGSTGTRVVEEEYTPL
jgi:hypothetical protein